MTKHHKLIIVIEDETPLQDALTDALTFEGYKVLSAFNGEEGLALIKKNKPDLVLLDIMMPVMNGMDVLKEMRSTPEYATTPVLLLTNINSVELIAQGMEYDIAGYIIKSDWSLEKLKADIKKIVEPGS